MVVVGGLVAGAALVGLLVSVWRDWIPIGRSPLGPARRMVWLGAGAVYAMGVAFGVGWPVVGLALPTLAGVVAARAMASRWDWSAPLAALAGLLLGALVLNPVWWLGIVVGVGALAGLAWLAGDRLVAVEHKPPILGIARKWWIIVALAATVGLLTGLHHRSAGLLACGFAAATLAAYILAVDLGSRGRLVAAGGLATLLVGPVVAWFGADRPVVELALVIVATLAVTYVGIDLYREATGPFDEPIVMPHPFDGTVLEWAWVGAVTASSATITARARDGVTLDEANIEVRPSGRILNLGAGLKMDPARFELDDLPADTPCTLTVPAHGQTTAGPASVTFRTFPTGRSSVRIAAGSCATTGSRATAFDRIRRSDVHVFVGLGDLHYENIAQDETSAFHAAYDTVLASAPQAALFSSTPTARIWDDHDYGPNNSDKSSTSRRASRIAYHEVEPHYPLRATDDEPGDGGPGAIYQSFTLGPVRLVLTDTRSERSPATVTNRVKNWLSAGYRREIMSPAQHAWLIERVKEAKADPNCELVVWCCSTPWIGTGNDPDIWEGFADQRKQVFDELRAIGMRLVYVSGDAHMIGIDDGTNSTTTAGVHGFPVLAAAALDRRPSTKGQGAYRFPDQGPDPNPMGGFGQFGIIDVDASGQELKVTLEAHSQGRVVHRYEAVDFDGWLAGAAP